MKKRRKTPSFGSPVKCVTVGDHGVGKTSLLKSYIDSTFKLEDPIMIDSAPYKITVPDSSESLQVVDSRGDEYYDKIRPLTYYGADFFIICFAINDRVSAEHVEGKWYLETQHYSPSTASVLVGTKVDLREAEPGLTSVSDTVSSSEGKELANRIKAIKYIECSALTQVGVAEIFDEIARVAAASRQNDVGTSFSCRCVLL